jgi:glycosyltransferase involved in cell wall biosynthesis
LKKVLLIIPNLGKGGAQQVFRDQLQFFSGRCPAIGCVFNWDGAFADDRNSNIVSLNVPGGTNIWSKFICFWKRVIALRKIKKQHHIDFCISHLEGADYVNLLSKRKEKVICWIHGTKKFDENIEGGLGLVRRKILIPFLYRLADRVVTVSEGIRQELILHFGISEKKTRTIYNSFILKELLAKAAEKVAAQFQLLFDTHKVLITHCRLSRQKNLFGLIDILVSVKNSSGAKLIILGDGELREDLLRYCDKNKLRTYTVWNSDLAFNLDYDIYFLGYERNPYPFLSKATLYLMTSDWEGFPLALCEAMASGAPVISADCFTGPREIISPDLETSQPIQQPLMARYGILMPLANTSNLKMWTDTIIMLLNDTQLRSEYAYEGKTRIAVFDRNKISAEWLELIGQTR